MFYNRKLLLALGAAIAVSTASPATTVAEQQRYDYSIVTEGDRLIGELQKQLTKIRVCLEAITPIIKKNGKHSPETLGRIVAYLTKLHKNLADLEKEKFIDTDTMAVASRLIVLNNAFIDHINDMLRTNFKDIDSYDINALISKAIATKSTSVDEKNIAQQLLINSKKLAQLKKKAEGLTWYNHTFRFVDDWMITPCQKYSIPRRATLAAGIAGLGFITWWLVDDKSHKTYFEGYFGEDRYKSWIGPQPDVSPVGSLNNKDELGYLGNISHQWHLWATGLSAAGFLFNLVKKDLGSEAKNISPKLQKYATILKNKLKGGVYHKEAERAADKVEHVRFADIFGQREIKRYMQHLVDYLEDPEAADRLGLTPPRGILLIGDTRTGKTFCVNALFGEINDMMERTGQSGKYNFFPLDALTIQKEGIDNLLRAVKHAAPCIVFIDEIDLLNLQRSGANNTLSEFLQAMGDAVNSKDSKKQVIVIAATNRPETLDVALRQPGRFGKELRFEYPNYEDRVVFITKKLAELSLNAEGLDIVTLAKHTENRSYEALNMIIKNAIIKARLRGTVLSQALLEEALDEDIYHIIPNYTKNIPQHELDILAAHFAGQALLLHLMDNSVQLAKVTIKQVMTELQEEFMWTHLTDNNGEKKEQQQRFEYGKVFTCHAQDSIDMNSQATKLKICKMYLAGFIAEELLLGSCSYSCHAETDKRNAMAIAKSIAFEGFDSKTMPKSIQTEKYNQALAIIEQCKREVRELLANNKDALKHLSDALLEHKTLDRDQVAAVINPSSSSVKTTADRTSDPVPVESK